MEEITPNRDIQGEKGIHQLNFSLQNQQKSLLVYDIKDEQYTVVKNDGQTHLEKVSKQENYSVSESISYLEIFLVHIFKNAIHNV